MRKEYSADGLSEVDAGDDPFALFRRWFDQAVSAQLHEPNAMILATCSADGFPSARIVLLKALDDRGFTFFTNYDSRKGREMAENPCVSLVFPWHALERQVRVEGLVEVVTAAESDDYFVNRPIGSRLGAWASAQSAIIPGREFLEQRHAELTAQYPDGNVPRPPNWGGYRVLPAVFEFWQGRPSRLHDRIRFSLGSGASWTRDRLSP
ncbi:MAG: pyridoxamine 5'-phosphate oxidase [Planctomycetaceae bacterium]|nr:pyridoxamine 5'-phosphate oxidase [Planctomycetaceae bacterium]